MREEMPPRRRFAVDAAVVSVGVLVVFIVDLMVEVPVGVAAGYSLFVLIAMLAERTRLILAAAGASILGIALASLRDPADALFRVSESQFLFSRGAQIGGILLVTALAVMGVRRRERLARAEQELTSSVQALEGTAARLRVEQESLKAVAEAMPVPVWMQTSDREVLYSSAAMGDYLGYDPRDGLSWDQAIHPDDLARANSLFENAVARPRGYAVELRIKRHDGAYRAHMVQVAPIPTGEETRWWASAIDVEELRASQREADRLAREHQETLESIDDGVITLTRDARYAYLNPAAARMIGADPKHLLGRLVTDVYSDVKGSELERAFAEVQRTGQPGHVVEYAEVLDKWFETTVTKSPTGLTLYVKDITELRELGQQLERTNRLESVGSLTGGIAHDFNNLLTVIIGGAEALADADLTPEDEAMRDMIAEAADRGSELIRALLAFARRQTLRPEPTSLTEVLATMQPLLQRTLGGAIEVKTDISTGLPAIMVDRGKLDNALLNLAINARDAMPEGGTVTLTVQPCTHDDVPTSLAMDLEAGDYVRLTVADTGSGIAADALPRLFEPFYTTKPLGSGSGLGLAMVWGFASQSGGTLTVESEPGAGAAFSLYLPVASDAPGAATPESGSVPEHGTGTVVLVEDDALVRSYTATRLRGLGYDVLEADGGRAGLAMLESHPETALLLTDVVMPGGMSGRELARAAAELRPGLPVLCVSGYTEQVLAADGRLDPGAELLTKPYTLHELAERVSRLVSEGRSADG
ncbi:hybrid sensor histidine kinase/response regulator [Demequina zhanjiangensis]|uniref:histidine kinase n=1 Tax=Demequina zhanjiangensis TaxID=3051659 RepID=A0ABT8G1J5_9MICO|nr:PAS domain-containing sensor histidine kinase [Demequina sp. SYSU T00b26]MDN4472997.1 PAS domain S-box protein [Demequina sp. SYSU T00b26]